MRPVAADERRDLAHQVGPGDGPVDVRDDDAAVPLPQVDRGVHLSGKRKPISEAPLPLSEARLAANVKLKLFRSR